MTDDLSEEVHEEIIHLRNRIDSIDEARKAESVPWFKNASTIIALAAFVFSFGTTAISYKRSADQEIHAEKAELRSILQRLTALPKENAENGIKYQNTPSLMQTLSGYVNQENLILSRQANDLIQKLSKDDQVSSTDYVAVAQALMSSRNYTAAIDNFDNARKSATDLDDEVTALRGLAYLQMGLGLNHEGFTEAGREHYKEALTIFLRRTGYDDYTIRSTTAQTDLNWAASEATAGNFSLARQHQDDAANEIAALPAGPGTAVLAAGLSESRNALARSAPLPSTNTSPVPTPALSSSLPTQGLEIGTSK